MEFLKSFLSPLALTVLIYSFVIAAGILLGKVKVGGISLGATFVLFVGIAVSHFGFVVDPALSHFIKEFGLILFVFSIGLQVGPNFFSSFKKGGLRLNGLAVTLIMLNILVALCIYFLLGGEKGNPASGVVPLPMLVGILSGAVTNTPGLGAAQEALRQLDYTGDPIALGYAVAYPLGVLGAIMAFILFRVIFKIDMEKEAKGDVSESSEQVPTVAALRIEDGPIAGKTIVEVKRRLGRYFVVSRIVRPSADGESTEIVPTAKTVMQQGDIVFVVTEAKDRDFLVKNIGTEVEYNVEPDRKSLMVSRQVLLSNPKIQGKRIGDLQLGNVFGVNITHVYRSGLDLFGSPDVKFQIGDRVTIVGEKKAVKSAERIFGNSIKQLNEPNIVTIFIGIMLGMLLGSVPIYFPGIPMPAKLGLAGGPLIVAILIGRFGYKVKLKSYTTQSANLMLREIGLCLFLSSVGLDAGGKFVETVVQGDGLLWVGCGFLITIIPMLVVGLISIGLLKTNYFTTLGLISGSTTDPPALGFSNSLAQNDLPAVAYSTVYPLSMFLRILTAQFVVLLLY